MVELSRAAGTLYRQLEPWLWCVLGVSSAIWGLRRLRAGLPRPISRALALLCAIAAVLRIVVPFAPPNWYFGIANQELSTGVFTRSTTFVPLLTRVALLHMGLGGVRALNLVTGVLAIPLLAHAAERGGHSRRTVISFAALLAVTPLYVRYSASDASQNLMLFLYACAAAAYASVERGSGGTPASLVLGCAIVLGVPIRAESSVLFLSVPLFVRMDGERWWPPLPSSKTMCMMLASGALGAAGLIGFQLDSIVVYGRSPDVGGTVLWLATRFLGILDPLLVSFFPLVIAVPIWVVALRALRARAWHELRSIYLPVLIGGAPSVLSAGLFMDIAGAGYAILSSLFVLLASARGLDAMLERMPWSNPPARRRHLVANVAISALALGSFVPGLFFTYAYQQEFRFLARALPREPATILTIFDPHHAGSHGDYDCCLALPSLPLRADRPGLRWIVLSAADLESPEKVRGLQFDYYYPGSLPQLDLDSFESKYAQMVQGADVRRAQKDHIAKLQELDRSLRARSDLETYASEVVPAHTFSSGAFRDDRMTLTIWRRKR